MKYFYKLEGNKKICMNCGVDLLIHPVDCTPLLRKNTHKKKGIIEKIMNNLN